MTIVEARIATLKSKIKQAEAKGNGTAGVVRKYKREVRKLESR